MAGVELFDANQSKRKKIWQIFNLFSEHQLFVLPNPNTGWPNESVFKNVFSTLVTTVMAIQIW